MTGVVELKRDMAVTHDEFYRLIMTTINDSHLIHVDIKNASVSFPYAEGEISITLEEQLTRKLASLSIHHTPMNFIFKNITQSDIQAYLQKFDVSFQKGGG